MKSEVPVPAVQYSRHLFVDSDRIDIVQKNDRMTQTDESVSALESTVQYHHHSINYALKKPLEREAGLLSSSRPFQPPSTVLIGIRMEAPLSDAPYENLSID